MCDLITCLNWHHCSQSAWRILVDMTVCEPQRGSHDTHRGVREGKFEPYLVIVVVTAYQPRPLPQI